MSARPFGASDRSQWPAAGYVLTVWASGAVVSGRRGGPSADALILFALGASAALVGAAIVGRSSADGSAMDAPVTAAAEGLLCVLAAACALAAAALEARIGGLVAWALVGFTVTAIYVVVTSIGPAARRRGS